MNAHSVDDHGEPVGQKLRVSDTGVQERAVVLSDGQVAITRWLRVKGRWEVHTTITLPAEAALNLAVFLAEIVSRTLDGSAPS